MRPGRRRAGPKSRERGLPRGARVLEPRSDRLGALEAQAGQCLDREPQRICRGIDAEPDDVQAPSLPARRHLDARDRGNAAGARDGGRRLEPGDRVVIGEREQPDAGVGDHRRERRGRQHAVRAGRMQVQVDGVVHALPPCTSVGPSPTSSTSRPDSSTKPWRREAPSSL